MQHVNKSLSGTDGDSIEQRTFTNIVTGQVGLGNEASDR